MTDHYDVPGDVNPIRCYEGRPREALLFVIYFCAPGLVSGCGWLGEALGVFHGLSCPAI